MRHDGHRANDELDPKSGSHGGDCSTISTVEAAGLVLAANATINEKTTAAIAPGLNMASTGNPRRAEERGNLEKLAAVGRGQHIPL
jgi:hypothetical protein